MAELLKIFVLGELRAPDLPTPLVVPPAFYFPAGKQDIHGPTSTLRLCVPGQFHVSGATTLEF